ncbi:hypothetical protein OIU34_19285 [Pararhizobium sp. BT-229]|uniref:hypothetical protein n=1 Tax=Pararhizobium sp. BT-229 TaxID=2986923 RepID=UPI0021F7AF4E|nr:hypothetical protein [Pararhizobium sp. BT-229]MCV9964027.1 hypothetical protein [Pararhizobium sp. BT-229]
MNLIVELAYPAVIRAKPPRCVSQKQVICTFETLATFDVMEDADFPVVAILRHAGGSSDDVRHDGEHFYRAVCRVEDGRSAFPQWMLKENYLRGTYLKLMEDERRNSLEHSELTWPSKGEGRRKERRHVTFSEVAGFELLEREDVTRCEGEIARLTASIRLWGGLIWIQCGEPCYRLRNSGTGLKTELTFADQDEGKDVDEAYISATDPQRLRDQWEAVSDRKAREEGYRDGAVEILDQAVFEQDFDDVAFMKYARLVARGIAYYLAGDGWFSDGRQLMSAAPDDVDLWSALRRSIIAMEAAGTATAGDDDTVMRAAELWSRLGGSFHARSRHYSRDTVAEWSGIAVRSWLDRKIEFDAIVAPVSGYGQS